MYKIELINKKTNEITTFDTLVDKNEGEKMFFKFEINTSLLTDGEWTIVRIESGGGFFQPVSYSGPLSTGK